MDIVSEEGAAESTEEAATETEVKE
jgi:hypothetical protein